MRSDHHVSYTDAEEQTTIQIAMIKIDLDFIFHVFVVIIRIELLIAN